MTTITPTAWPVYPIAPHEADRLRCFLNEQNYSPVYVALITNYALVNGTLGGLVELDYLDPSDEADAAEAFIAGLDASGPASIGWLARHRYCTLSDLEDAADGFPRGRAAGLRSAVLIPPELDDDADCGSDIPFLVSA